MTRPGQKVSKRAAHKAAVAARKGPPIVKVCKNIGRRNALPFPPDFFAMARESEREGVLLSLIAKLPRTYRAETVDAEGNSIVVALKKSPRPTRGWDVLLPQGEGLHFATKREALKFIGLLTVEFERATQPENTEDELTEAARKAEMQPVSGLPTDAGGGPELP